MQAAQRIYVSATTAGAMSRLFIGVGTSDQKQAISSYLTERGLEIIEGQLSPFNIWPEEFNRHQGTHFNRKFFVLSGLETIVGKIGDDILKRIQFERRTLEKTATWSFFWLESFDVAQRFREVAPQVWKTANIVTVFPPLNLSANIRAGKWSALEEIKSSLGDLPIPTNVAKESLPTLLQGETNRFWGDFLGLFASDALLSFQQAVSKGEEISPEALNAAAKISAGLGMTALAKALEKRNTSIPSLSGSSEETWVGKGERVIAEADHILQTIGVESAINALNTLLEGPNGWLENHAGLLIDRPIRFRALLHRAAGKITEAASDIDRWEEMAQNSGLTSLIASAYEARALHMEEMGDTAQAEKWRSLATEIKVTP